MRKFIYHFRAASVLLAFSVVVFYVTSVAMAQREIVIVVGADGEPEFGEQFQQWGQGWQETVADSFNVTTIGLGESDKASREKLLTRINELSTAETQPELWLVLIGHGTFDGKTAKFNLGGPDLSAEDLQGALKGYSSRFVLLNCSSCSSPFLNALAAPNRVVVSATRDGNQYNFSRFGGFLAGAISDTSIDLDKDEQTSLLEAFLAASKRTEEFYREDERLATEQALLEDNGDSKGTPANWFIGNRVVKGSKSGAAPDGQLANQLFIVLPDDESRLSESAIKTRNDVESKIEVLRGKKAELDEDVYYEELEKLMLQLGRLYSGKDS